MKTEYDYGRDTAIWMLEHDRENAVEQQNLTADIMPEDYNTMKRDGIENPDSEKYWNGFNSAF